VRADFGRGAGGEFLAEVQHRHVVADVDDQVGMVLYQQHASAAADRFADGDRRPRECAGR
jgi:hypothetical protein